MTSQDTNQPIRTKQWVEKTACKMKGVMMGVETSKIHRVIMHDL